MTIFVNVVTQLINEALSDRSVKLKGQTASYLHNTTLSETQRTIITQLATTISRYQSISSDEQDHRNIVTILTKTRDEIRTTRQQHQQKEEGETTHCLNNLILSTESFYQKLGKLNFPLLDRPYTNTPENIVYTKACYYLGQEIFDPQHGDHTVREAKEKAVEARLIQLAQLIKDEQTLDERRKWTKQVLSDLDADNLKAGQPAVPRAIPGVSIMGVFSLTAPDILAARKGRLGSLLKQAGIEIEQLTIETAACPKPEGAAINSSALSA